MFDTDQKKEDLSLAPQAACVEVNPKSVVEKDRTMTQRRRRRLGLLGRSAFDDSVAPARWRTSVGDEAPEG